MCNTVMIAAAARMETGWKDEMMLRNQQQ